MSVSRVTKLSGNMEKQLPAALTGLMRAAGELVRTRGQSLYLVGGVVRDLLLGRTNLDIDLVVEGDAVALAQELALSRGARITVHRHFGTAKLQWDDLSVDLATARSETYARPGALPTVKPGSIHDDLHRRDFTVNAIAVQLAPGHYGELLDPYGGRADLERKLIRVLHEKSFIDDATRIWRGIRYEQRLDFQMEPDTLELVRRDREMLVSISGDRIRHELELVLTEDSPEQALRRADELGVLARLHPSLRGNGWLANSFERARQSGSTDPPYLALYLALLAYRLSVKESEQFISYLRLPKATAQLLRDTLAIKEKLEILSAPDLKPGGIYAALHGYGAMALNTSLLATDSPLARERIRLFMSKLRYVRPALGGDDLKRMGITEGPLIKEVLNRLRNARLDGKVRSKQNEEEMVRRLLNRDNS